MKFILGQKKEMTQLFKDDGSVIPATVVAVKKNFVTQIKTAAKDGYTAIQVSSGVTKKSHTKAQLGHLQGLKSGRWIREFRFYDEQAKSLDQFKRGLEFGVEIFRPGDKVEVAGVSKGRGFQGVVKRHGFRGAPKTHGTKDQMRMPGSIGATGPAHVFKGRRMPGRMGADNITIKGLQVVKVDAEKELLYIKGALPGAYNSLIMISGPGTFKVTKSQKSRKHENMKEEKVTDEVKNEGTDEQEKVEQDIKEKETEELENEVIEIK